MATTSKVVAATVTAVVGAGALWKLWKHYATSEQEKAPRDDDLDWYEESDVPTSGLPLRSALESKDAVWRTKSLGDEPLTDIMDCEPCGDRAENDPDNWWGGRDNRVALVAAASRGCVSVVDKSAGPAVSFVDQQTQQTLTQREFLSLFLPEFDDDDDNPFADDDVQRVPSRVQSTEKRRVFEGSHDIDEARRRWARAVAAAGAFRAAVLKCSANHSGGVYWKGPGMAASTMNDPFVALCCPTVAPLSAVGDGSKFETNQDELKSEKVEYTRVHPVRMVSPDGARVRVPGTHGFVMFKSPSSTLVVPGRTRKHRCRAPVPVVGVWGGLTNADGMAHLASALQARNARLIMDDDGDGELVRDGEAQFLVTDEELATGLRLVALEIRRQIADASVRGEPENHRVFWCTHGHDIPWLHFKVMGTSAVLKKMGKGPLKEQYTVEHLRLLGYDENAVAQRTVQPK